MDIYSFCYVNVCKDKKVAMTRLPNSYRLALKNWRVLKVTMGQFIQKSYFSYQTDPLTQQVFERMAARISEVFANQPVVHDIAGNGVNVIALAGERGVVLKLKDKLLSMIAEFQTQIQEEKNVSKQTIPNVPRHQIEYLNLVDFFNRMMQKHQLKSFTGDPSKQNVTFEGRPGCIDAAQTEMLNLLPKIADSKIAVTKKSIFTVVLDTVFARQSIHQQFLIKKISAVWVLENKTISVYSESKHVSAIALKCIEDAVWEAPYPADHSFDELEKQLLKSPLWQNKKAEIIQAYQPVEIQEQADQLSLSMAGLAQHKPSVMEQIPLFFDLNVKRTLPFQGHPDRILFLHKFKRDIFRTLEKDHNVHLRAVNGEKGLEITGTKDNIANCGRQLKKEHDNICKAIHVIEHQAMIQHINEDEESLVTPGWKTECLVVLHKEEPAMEVAVPIFSRKSASSTTRYSVNLPSGSLCEVQNGDLTGMTCDAIVNAANGDLQHVGGLALAIIERGM